MKLSLHPNDPPVHTIAGVPCLITSRAAYERAYAMAGHSPMLGMKKMHCCASFSILRHLVAPIADQASVREGQTSSVVWQEWNSAVVAGWKAVSSPMLLNITLDSATFTRPCQRLSKRRRSISCTFGISPLLFPHLTRRSLMTVRAVWGWTKTIDNYGRCGYHSQNNDLAC